MAKTSEKQELVKHFLLVVMQSSKLVGKKKKKFHGTRKRGTVTINHSAAKFASLRVAADKV